MLCNSLAYLGFLCQSDQRTPGGWTVASSEVLQSVANASWSGRELTGLMFQCSPALSLEPPKAVGGVCSEHPPYPILLPRQRQWSLPI